MAHKPKAEIELTTHRIESFSDGVFAIAITLLVLELKVPRLPSTAASGNPSSLTSALLSLWPSYFGYIFSFVMIGIHWVNHHYIFKLYERSDHLFALLNGFYLMCISFLPFPTAVLAAYIADPRYRQTAIVFYAIGLFMPAFSWLLIWLYASHDHRLVNRNLDDGFIAHLTRRYVLTNALYLAAVLLCLWNALAGLALCVGLTLLYLLPSRKPVFRPEAAENPA
jgi:uncharacterized membrane protein